MAITSLQGRVCHTVGDLPGVGAQAPDFILQDNRLEDQTLANYNDIGKLIYTVPSLDTMVCAKSAKALDKLAQETQKIHFIIISRDLPFAQQRFCKQNKLKHISTLSLMRSNQFAEAYGVLLVDGPLEGLLARALFALDVNNKIVHNELAEDITKVPDFASAIESLAG